VVDPGDDVDAIVRVLKDLALTVCRCGAWGRCLRLLTLPRPAPPCQPTHIYHTHGHFDHILAAGKLKALYPDARICLHAEDRVRGKAASDGPAPVRRCNVASAQFWWDHCEELARTFGITVPGPLPPVDVALRKSHLDRMAASRERGLTPRRVG
jgi:glyoxylase-like metal-dependent hydrolase (beta-lactamase superfamily II)